MVTTLRVVSAREGSSVEAFVVLYSRQPCVTNTYARVSLRTFLHMCIILTEIYGGWKGSDQREETHMWMQDG
jgi:hypothetical protein